MHRDVHARQRMFQNMRYVHVYVHSYVCACVCVCILAAAKTLPSLTYMLLIYRSSLPRGEGAAVRVDCDRIRTLVRSRAIAKCTQFSRRSVVMEPRYDSPRQIQTRSTCTKTQHASLPIPQSRDPQQQQQLTFPLPTSPETNDNNSYALLASCMHAGSRIVRLSRSEAGEWTFDVLAKFEEHKSMNYGSDVQPVESGKTGERRTVVSTSFYDKLMCVWEFGEG